MNRTENLAMWRRIANGDLEHEQYDSINPWEWIRKVANKIVDADSESTPNRRNAATLRAVGVSGTRDRYVKLRELIVERTMFSPLDDDGKEIPQTTGEIVSDIVKTALERKLLKGTYVTDDKKAKDLVRNILHHKI